MAQTVGPLNGTLVKIEIGGSEIAHLTSCTQSFSMSSRDASSKDSGGWKEALEGQKSWTMAGDGLFAEDATFGYVDLYDAWTARTQVTIKQTDSATGDIEYAGSAYITSLERTTGNEETATFSVSFEGTGAITKATIA